MSRLENTSKNFIFSTISTVLSSVLGFISRTVFIYIIGATYLGANSLFTNILSMLSLTELGIGNAISFSLYKPLAKNDIETVKSLMQFYKKAYRYIALAIISIGLLLIPFLDFFIKDSGGIEHITLIYLIFLYNTVISYLFSYKITLLAADQKSYLMTNVNMIISLVTLVIQLIVLVLSKNYFCYLISGAVIGTVQWYFINKFIYKRYPYLRDKNVNKLNSLQLNVIKTNVKAMMFHKIGELCINQTDNIIISSFINLITVGLYNNYYMIINIINKFALSLFNAASASLGNLIATENEEKRYSVFKVYNFLGFWVFGWTTICLTILLNPFVTLWIGKEYCIDNLTLGLVMINYYLVGMRVTVGNIKMAAGLYSQDQWVPIIQSIVNLVVSIWGAIHLGLAGVFLGTVVSSLILPCWYRPIIVYKYVFKRSSSTYFITYFQYAVITSIGYILSNFLGEFFTLYTNTIILELLIKAIICLIIPNIIIIAIFYRKQEFQYILKHVKLITGKLIGRLKDESIS